MEKRTEERFLEDIQGHELTIIRDDQNGRHIRLSKPASSSYFFDIITWGGCLCISGDVGTYVFSRTKDMFEFFREGANSRKDGGTLHINKGYWGEKLLSVGTNAGYKKFSESKFRHCVKEEFEQWEFNSDLEKEEVWQEVITDVLDRAEDCEISATEAAMLFSSSLEHQFTDFWVNDLKEYSHHYVWSLYAIAWGIKQYDAAITKKAVA